MLTRSNGLSQRISQYFNRHHLPVPVIVRHHPLGNLDRLHTVYVLKLLAIMRSQYSVPKIWPFSSTVSRVPSCLHYAIQYTSGCTPPHDTFPLTPNAHAFYHHPMHHSRHPAQPTTRQPGPTIPVGDPHPIPHSPFTPLEQDKCFVAGSDINMRQMRQISALQIPSPATALSPFAAIFRCSPDTNLPRVRQRFPSWPRYNHETNKTISATKISPQLRFLSRQLRTLAQPPVFAATKSPGMRPDFRSWLTYNHETPKTNETAIPRNRDLRSLQNTPPKAVSKMSHCDISPATKVSQMSQIPRICDIPRYEKMSHFSRIWPASKMSQMTHFSATKNKF